MKTEIKVITYEKNGVGIAPMADGMEDMFFSIFNDNEVLEYMGDWGLNPKSLSYIREYLHKHRDDTWIICKIVDGKWLAIGYCGIFIRSRHKVGILRVAVERQYRGKGGISIAYGLLIKHAFDALGLNALHASMVDNNEKSIKPHEKLGFEVCGRYKNSRIDLSSKVRGEILMELTKEKYENTSNI